MSDAQTEADVASENDAQVAQEPEVPTGESATPEGSESVEDTNKVQKRINKLTWEKHEAVRKAQELEERLKAAESKPKAEPSEALGDLNMPQYADYGTDKEYQEALNSYNAQAFDRLYEQRQAEAQQAEVERARQQKRADYQARIAAYAEKNDGFIEALSESNIPISDELAEVLIESDKAAELTHWLASNPDAAIRIQSLSPIQAAKELGRIEASIDAVAPKKVSDAPPPMSDLSGSDSSMGEDLSKIDDPDEWRRRRNAQLRERGRI